MEILRVIYSLVTPNVTLKNPKNTLIFGPSSGTQGPIRLILATFCRSHGSTAPETKMVACT